MKFFFEWHFSLDIFRQMEYIYPSYSLRKNPKEVTHCLITVSSSNGFTVGIIIILAFDRD